MNKVMLLVPCLMLDTNRKRNKNCIDAARRLEFDKVVVCAQQFQESDKTDGVEYIGNHAEGIGFVKARNELLKFFYESDFDYAMWLDANAQFSRPCLNDLHTLLSALKAGEVPVDVIFATLGLQISGERINAKRMGDHSEVIRLVQLKGGYDWMHGMVIKNFRKYYGIEPYIDSECSPYKGTSEDIFFARMCKYLFDCRLLPTLVITKPLNKFSTWVADQKGYKYPPVNYKVIDRMVLRHCQKFGFKPKSKTRGTVVLPRIEEDMEYIRGYISRSSKKGISEGLLKNESVDAQKEN